MDRSCFPTSTCRPTGERLWMSDGVTELWLSRSVDSNEPGLLRLIRPGIPENARRRAKAAIQAEREALRAIRSVFVPQLRGGSASGEGEDAEQWLSMSAAEGTVLRELLARPGGVSAGRVAWWLRLSCQLLDDLRFAGIEHGAIDPGCLVLTPTQTLLLVDFTGAKRLSAGPEESSDERAVRRLAAWFVSGDASEADRLSGQSDLEAVAVRLAKARPDLEMGWLRGLARFVIVPADSATSRADRMARVIALELATLPRRVAA